MGIFGRVNTDCLLNTGVLGLGQSGFIITDPPEQCAEEFTMFALTGLGVGSGWYIGDGGEYGGGAAGPEGITHAGVIILTLTGRTGDLLALTLLNLLGKLSLAKDTDLDLLDDGLVAVGV